MRSAVEGLMKRLKLPINAEKTRCCRVPEEPMTFLGYRIGRNYRRNTGRAYIGTRPSPASVQSICRRVSELTTPRSGLLSPKEIVTRLNRLLTGWANYFTLGQVSPAYAAIDRHATRRLRSGSVASTRCGRCWRSGENAFFCTAIEGLIDDVVDLGHCGSSSRAGRWRLRSC